MHIRSGLLLLLMVVAAPGVPPLHAAEQYIVGEHYAPVRRQQKVDDPGKIEVVEVFWYGCPHCYDFEPHLNPWLAKLPEDVVFRRMPAVFRQSWVPHARAYYTAELLGALDKIHGPLFEAIHEKKRSLDSEDALVAFFVEQGLDEAEVREVYSSFGVDNKVRKAALLSREYGIPGVPAVIVNGKYFTSGGMAGSYPGLLKVTEFLVDKERQAASGSD